MNFSCSLVFDIGTSSVKAGLFFSEINLAPIIVRRPYQLSKRGWWLDAWMSAFKEAVCELKSAAQEAWPHLEGVLIGGNGPSLIVVNGQGEPLGDVIRWADVDDSFRGHQSYYLSLFQTAEMRLDLSKAACFLSPAEFFAFQLTHRPATFSPREALDSYFWDLSDKKVSPFCTLLPPFVRWGELMGVVDEQGASFCDIPVGTKLYAGAPDYALALVGAGATTPGVVCDRTGTSEGINFVWNHEQEPPAELLKLNPGFMPHPIEGLDNYSFVFDHHFDAAALKQQAELWRAWGHLSKQYGFRWVVTGGLAKDEAISNEKAKLLGHQLEVSPISEVELVGGYCIMAVSQKKFSDVKAALSAILNLN